MDLLSHWHHLTTVDIARHIMTGKLGQLSALKKPLLRLNLSATELAEEDLEYLAGSHHAAGLQDLNLDFNNLHRSITALVKLFTNLKSVRQLRTCCGAMDLGDCLKLADSLSHSQTLDYWNVVQNDFGSFSDLQQLVNQCSQIRCLRQLGCKPPRIIHSHLYRPLTDLEDSLVSDMARSLNLMVY